MIDYEYDDGGRADAGRKGNARDCVCRAICILTGRPYKQVYAELCEVHKAKTGKRSARCGIHTNTAACVRYLESIGVTKVKLPKGPRPTWSEAHETYGDCIVSTTHHWACIRDGALRDTDDCREYEWVDGIRERKAASVFVLADG